MALTWNAATMSTGDATIDRQHMELIGHLNELIDRMRSGTAREGLAELLDFLGDYAVKHFRHEEGCMDAHRCPAAAVNRQAHAQFIQVFTRLRDRIARDGATTTLVLETQKELSAWLGAHIVRVDVQLKSCLKNGR